MLLSEHFLYPKRNITFFTSFLYVTKIHTFFVIYGCIDSKKIKSRLFLVVTFIPGIKTSLLYSFVNELVSTMQYLICENTYGNPAQF